MNLNLFVYSPDIVKNLCGKSKLENKVQSPKQSDCADVVAKSIWTWSVRAEAVGCWENT